MSPRPVLLSRSLTLLVAAFIAVLVSFGGLVSAPASATAPTITSFTPAAGTVGSVVTITGTSLTGATAVRFNGATASTYTVVNATTISAHVPAKSSTGPISVVTPGGTATSSTNFVVQPGLSRTPSTVAPAGTETIYGVGYAAFERVDIYFDTTDVALVSTDANGAFGPVTLKVPRDAPSGTHYITAEGRASEHSSQKAITVNVDWADFGGGPTHQGYNSKENVLSTANVDRLDASWVQRLSPWANRMSMIESGGTVFVAALGHALRAYRSDGTILWRVDDDGSFAAVSDIAAGGGYVFVDGGNGNVKAYRTACRSDGGVCTATWTHSVGTSITGGLTYRNGLVYVPSADSTIHVLNATTGAEGTALAPFGATATGATTDVTLAADGSYSVGYGAVESYNADTGSASSRTLPGYVSTTAMFAGQPFYTDSSGELHGGSGWDVTTSAGCSPAPAAGDAVVIAGGCSTLGAYSPGSGTARWILTGLGDVYGNALANGVVYACVNGVIKAYHLAYGGELWTGGYCDGQPMIVNNTLYVTGNGQVTAYTLDGDPAVGATRPSARALVPNRSLTLSR